MTRVAFFSQIDKWIGFEITGHTDFGAQGEDILCAAISSAALMTANTITEILHIDAQEQVHDGYLKVLVAKEQADACQALFAGLKLHLEELSSQYNDNLKVISMEV